MKRVSAITGGLRAVGGIEQIPLPSNADRNIPTIRHTGTSQDKWLSWIFDGTPV